MQVNPVFYLQGGVDSIQMTRHEAKTVNQKKHRIFIVL